MAIKKLAIRHIANQVRNLRIEQQDIESKHMNFECQFDDPEAEEKYVELGKLCGELELFCCRTFEEATFFAVHASV